MTKRGDTMPIKFSIRPNKNFEPRINILKPVTGEGVKGKKVSKNDTVGSLHGFDDQTIETFVKEKNFNEQEFFELEEISAQLSFNRNDLGKSLESMERKMLYFAKPYHQALFELWLLSKKHNISFCPAEIMHRALLHKAKAVERRLNELEGKPVNKLQGIGIDIARLDEDEARHIKQVNIARRKLFKSLLALPIAIPNLCQEFESIAKESYGKIASMKPHYFKDLSTSLKRFKLWYNTVAIDLLLRHHQDLLTVLPIDLLAENWIRLRKNSLTQEEAITQFKDTFHPKTEDEPIFIEIIKKAYEKGISTTDI